MQRRLVDSYLRDGVKTSLPATTLSYAEEDTLRDSWQAAVLFSSSIPYLACVEHLRERERW